jgi:uncharacterized protein (UPF0276 family)
MTLFGLGLRKPHYEDVLSGNVQLDFVEVISENFMFAGGRPLADLLAVRAKCPVALHGVSMSIGSTSGLDHDYVQRLRALVDIVNPLFVSDHLCWTRVPGFSSHDLLPLPCTQEVLDIVSNHVHAAQEILGRQMLVENPSAYLGFTHSEMPEWEFLSELCARTGCGLLLDVNNVYVSARNLGFDPADYIAHFPLDRVRQIHIAGHSQGEDLLIDTHDQPVCAEVWDLFETAMTRAGPVAVMIERDDNIPPISELLDELAMARTRADAATKRGLQPCI